MHRQLREMLEYNTQSQSRSASHVPRPGTSDSLISHVPRSGTSDSSLREMQEPHPDAAEA